MPQALCISLRAGWPASLLPQWPPLHGAFSQDAQGIPASAKRHLVSSLLAWSPTNLTTRVGGSGEREVGSKNNPERFHACPCCFPSWSPLPPQLARELGLPLSGSEKSTIWQFHRAPGLVSIQPTPISSSRVCRSIQLLGGTGRNRETIVTAKTYGALAAGPEWFWFWFCTRGDACNGLGKPLSSTPVSQRETLPCGDVQGHSQGREASEGRLGI